MTMYEHIKLIGAIKNYRKFDSLLMRLLMGKTLFSDKNTVAFDTVTDDLTIAPLVRPATPGLIQGKEGYETVTLSPAYTKPKMSVNFSEVIARPAGAQINSNLSNKARYKQILKEDVRLIDGRVERLKAYMLSQLVNDGKVEIMSPQYGNYLLDFQRDAGLTSVLAGALRWGEPGVKPVDDLEDFVGLMDRPTRAIVFSPEAWALYRRDNDIKDWLSKDNLSRLGKADKLAINPIQYEEVMWKRVGSHDLMGVDLYVDSSYVMIGGVKTRLVPAHGIQIIPEKNLGVMGYGAIQDSKAKFQAYELFMKTFEMDDPGVPFILGQSAPVPFHTAINATGYLQVR